MRQFLCKKGLLLLALADGHFCALLRGVCLGGTPQARSPPCKCSQVQRQARIRVLAPSIASPNCVKNSVRTRLFPFWITASGQDREREWSGPSGCVKSAVKVGTGPVYVPPAEGHHWAGYVIWSLQVIQTDRRRGWSVGACQPRAQPRRFLA